MKKIFLIVPIILSFTSYGLAAQLPVAQITGVKPSINSLKVDVNSRLADIHTNFGEVYTALNGAPWLVQTTAPNITNVFWIDTSGASPVIKYYDGDSWEVAAAGKDGTYTLPVATSSVLGGVKQGAGTSIAEDGTLSVTAAGLGLGTTDNPSFLSVHASGGDIAAANNQVTKAWASGLSYTANVTSVIHGGKHYICTSTHTAGSTTEPGAGASWATVWSKVSGAGDNLGTAAAPDIIALFGSGSCRGYLYSDGTCSTPSGAAHDAVTLDANLGNNLLGLSTQQLTLDSQTANYIFAAPNGSAGVPSFRALVAADVPALPATRINITDSGNYFTGTNVETVLQELGAFPTLAFGTGLTAAVDTPSAGTTTVSVTAKTYQAYDANMIAWPSAISATEIGYIDGITASVGSVGGLPKIIASGTYTVDTGSINANKCASAVAVTATGVATTDTIIATPNAILSTVAGFGVTTAGAVRVDVYPTSGNVNFQFCNPTGTVIDPGSVTFNWRVLR